jgi:hypothetical protein
MSLDRCCQMTSRVVFFQKLNMFNQQKCENLKKKTNCPNEKIVALLSVIASNFALTTQNMED